ncbi:DUF2330 domain-containing protein [Candidatus Thiosymbion oneisti]|uniref:DUF2330 domain-containing protein n=1 Tax=Candidatus Thiosymbion oneisti TaxID=589554 RepID=UPI000A9AA574|nr:DUF2330 domain-containing protein [Candidatus Thiosymbion oneisti]
MNIKPIHWLLLCLLTAPNLASAFCGFYVAKADTKLFNRASQVVMVRDGDKNVVTMASDFQGDVDEFAMVVPVPKVLQEKQIHVTEKAILEHLDAYSAPRLVEYFDEDPCRRYEMAAPAAMAAAPMAKRAVARRRAKSLGVTIEAEYQVGEYDILILSAKESDGLVTWLTENGYKLPRGARPVVGSYLKQGMKFFVAKINLESYRKGKYGYLRPLQIAYSHRKFMLPIRLGTVNAKGPQELFIYALTRKGRVETTNYRTVKLPANIDIPVYIKEEDKFADFYRDLFRTQVTKEGGRAVFLEYAWDMNWCDPCAADPLSNKELRELGVFWLDDRRPAPRSRPAPRIAPPAPGAKDVYITRLHLRYDRAHFPEDLKFQVTGNRENFQGRYVIRHPWQGDANCEAAKRYLNETLPRRLEQEADNLARLTGWDIKDIRARIKLPRRSPTNAGSKGDKGAWWEDIWEH